MNTNEVFYNFNTQKATESDKTILKVNIENPGRYVLPYIDGDISDDKPTDIDFGNGTVRILTAPIKGDVQSNNYIDYSKPGEYEISIDGWYNHFICYGNETESSGVTPINNVLVEIIQVSSLITDFTGTFYNCSMLKSVPTGLFDKNTNTTSFSAAFERCTSLTSIPPGLFDKNTQVADFSYMFYNCENLTGEAPYTLLSDGRTKIKLWDRNGTNGFTKPTSTYGAFYYCTQLTDYEDIPDDWK